MIYIYEKWIEKLIYDMYIMYSWRYSKFQKFVGENVIYEKLIIKVR